MGELTERKVYRGSSFKKQSIVEEFRTPAQYGGY